MASGVGLDQEVSRRVPEADGAVLFFVGWLVGFEVVVVAVVAVVEVVVVVVVVVAVVAVVVVVAVVAVREKKERGEKKRSGRVFFF